MTLQASLPESPVRFHEKYSTMEDLVRFTELLLQIVEFMTGVPRDFL